MKIYTFQYYKYVIEKRDKKRTKIANKVNDLLRITRYFDTYDAFVNGWVRKKIQNFQKDMSHMKVRILKELNNGYVLVVGYDGLIFFLSSHLAHNLGEKQLEQLVLTDHYYTLFDDSPSKYKSDGSNYLFCRGDRKDDYRLVLRGPFNNSICDIPIYKETIPKEDIIDILADKLFLSELLRKHAPDTEHPAELKHISVEQMKDILTECLPSYILTMWKFRELSDGSIEYYTGLQYSNDFEFDYCLAQTDNHYNAKSSRLVKGQAEIRKLFCRAYFLESLKMGKERSLIPKMCEELTGGNYKSPITEDDITKALDHFKV